MNNPAKK